MRIGTLNAQNLRLQRPGGRDHLHGAWDADVPEDQALDPIDRRLTAGLMTELRADVVALQEVFDQETLDYFHEEFLLPAGAPPYPHRICLPGNDGRGLDVALMSRRPVAAFRSHAPVTLTELDIAAPEGVDPDRPVFRRDCLMAAIGPLTLFVCHFKSPYPDATAAWTTRRLEALATRRLVERHAKDPANDLWLVLGDLNEPSGDSAIGDRAIAPLETAFAVDLMQRLPQEARWTYYDPHSGRYHCPDAMLASPALAGLYPAAKPVVHRKGLGGEASRFHGSRLAGVGRHRPHASDHAAVVVEFPGL